MIFPELPRRTWGTLAETPLHSVEVHEEPVKVNVDEWFRQHGLAVDPAAGMRTSAGDEPINWLARDAVEFYALITVYAVWLTYWLGIHREWW
jgi:hypothetical protein